MIALTLSAGYNRWRPSDLVMKETVLTTERQEMNQEKVARFKAALDQFIERVTADRYVLAVVLVGSLTEATIWRKDSIGVWVIEADGVSRRLRSDGKDERIFRVLVEEGINLHAEVIPRSRFKQMIEGSSRTAFSCNFFEKRSIVYCRDPSIKNWFEQANTVAVKDKERELLRFSTWTFYALRGARRLLEQRKDLELAQQGLLHAAHSIAHTEIIRWGKVWEDLVIYKAMELNPELFQVIYTDVLAKRKNRTVLRTAADAIDGYLGKHFKAHLKPLLTFLKKEDRVVPLSEIGDHFAFSQVYPWHIEAACEWLERRGELEKLSAPFKLTKRSQDEVEEPAYYYDR